jgi:hypothetical protein
MKQGKKEKKNNIIWKLIEKENKIKEKEKCKV